MCLGHQPQFELFFLLCSVLSLNVNKPILVSKDCKIHVHIDDLGIRAKADVPTPH